MVIKTAEEVVFETFKVTSTTSGFNAQNYCSELCFHVVHQLKKEKKHDSLGRIFWAHRLCRATTSQRKGIRT